MGVHGCIRCSRASGLSGLLAVKQNSQTITAMPLQNAVGSLDGFRGIQGHDDLAQCCGLDGPNPQRIGNRGSAHAGDSARSLADHARKANSRLSLSTSTTIPATLLCFGLQSLPIGEVVGCPQSHYMYVSRGIPASTFRGPDASERAWRDSRFPRPREIVSS